MDGNLRIERFFRGVPLVRGAESSRGFPLGPTKSCGDALAKGPAGRLVGSDHAYDLRSALGGIGFNVEMAPVRGFELVERDVGVLKRRQVAVEHRSCADLTAYRMLVGDDAKDFRIGGNNHVVDEIDRLSEMAFNPGANPHPITLVEFHA